MARRVTVDRATITTSTTITLLLLLLLLLQGHGVNATHPIHFFNKQGDVCRVKLLLVLVAFSRLRPPAACFLARGGRYSVRLFAPSSTTLFFTLPQVVRHLLVLSGVDLFACRPCTKRRAIRAKLQTQQKGRPTARLVLRLLGTCTFAPLSIIAFAPLSIIVIAAPNQVVEQIIHQAALGCPATPSPGKESQEREKAGRGAGTRWARSEG